VTEGETGAVHAAATGPVAPAADQAAPAADQAAQPGTEAEARIGSTGSRSQPADHGRRPDEGTVRQASAHPVTRAAAADGAVPVPPAGTGPDTPVPAGGTLPLPVAPPRTGADAWLITVHVLIGLWTGMVSFVLLAWMLPLGVVLTPVFLIGLPILAVGVVLSRGFGALERARYRLVLGVDISSPHPPVSAEATTVRRFSQLARSPATWREAGYHLLRFPLSAVEVALVAAAWLVPLAALSLPIYNRSLPGGGADLWVFTVQSWWATVLVGIAGLVLLPAAPRIVCMIGQADVAFGRRLLGPDRLAVRVGELERSRAAVVISAEEERRRIERDLHDGAQQRLVALAMQLGRAKARFGTDPDGARALLDEAHAEAKLALAELRDLARGLHPAVLTDRGLDAALSGLAARSPVPVVVEVDPAVGAAAPVPVLEAIAYFVVAEALTNVAKHAHATRAAVVVRRLDGMLRVVVTDDGTGGADPAGGSGLRGLADRVSGVDGRLHVVSPSGGPTVLTVELPCAS